MGQEKKQLWNIEEVSAMNGMLYKQQTINSASIGTATIIYHDARYFLVTAAHVSKDMDDSAYIVLREQGDIPLKIKLNELAKSGAVHWKTHPEADIALMEIFTPTSGSKHDRIVNNAFPINQIFNGTELPAREIDLNFFGFPIIDLDAKHFSVLSFTGKISSGLITQKRGDNKQNSTFFYLNVPSIQGCSGSGVYYSISKSFYQGGDKTILLGIMHGTFSDNTGGKLAAVTPTYYLFDLLK